MKKAILMIAGGFVLFALIPALLIYYKERRPMMAGPAEPAQPVAPMTGPPSAGQSPSPSAPAPMGSQVDQEAAKQAAKDHMQKLRNALKNVLAQKKYAYVLIKNEGLEDELMRQMMIMAKLGQTKTVGQAVNELVDVRMKELLITPENESSRLKEVQEFYYKKIRSGNYEQRRDLCVAAGGAFTGSAQYVGDLVDQFLRACVCTNSNASIGQQASVRPVLYLLSCGSP